MGFLSAPGLPLALHCEYVVAVDARKLHQHSGGHPLGVVDCSLMEAMNATNSARIELVLGRKRPEAEPRSSLPWAATAATNSV